MPFDDTPIDRLRNRISYFLDAQRDRPARLRKTQQGLAKKLGIAKSSLSELLHEPAAQQGLLAYLDRIADYFETTPAYFVARANSPLIEVTPDEARLLKYWRAFSLTVRERLMELLEFHAGLTPEDIEEREVMRRFRRLTVPNRKLVDLAIERALAAQRRGQTAVETPDQQAPHREPAAPVRRTPRQRRA